MNDDTQEQILQRENLDYWVSQANEVFQILECGSDYISQALELSSILRDLYLQGKKDGVYIYNNTGDR